MCVSANVSGPYCAGNEVSGFVIAIVQQSALHSYLLMCFKVKRQAQNWCEIKGLQTNNRFVKFDS